MVIFDTNILVSAALLSGSRADVCVRAVLARQLPLIFSKATYDELADVLMRSKLDRYVSRRSRESLLRTWRKAAVMFPEATLREQVRDCRDPDDDKFLDLLWPVVLALLSPAMRICWCSIRGATSASSS